VGQFKPARPLDGISLKPLIDNKMASRAQPICFWSYNAGRDVNGGLQPYIAPELQEGTTELVKRMNGRLTRNFRNFHHPAIREEDFAGPRAILDNRYKLVIDGQPGAKPGSESVVELFDLRADLAEEDNLIEAKPQIAKKLERQLRDWQQSVLKSLTGADYR
jgi:hypothetical protein